MFATWIASLLCAATLCSSTVFEGERPARCQLTDAAYDTQVAEAGELFAQHLEVRELEDGYAFRFPGDDDLAERLAGFVTTERRCCTFFAFDLSFAPERGPVWLTVHGSAEVKALVASWTGLE